MNTPHAVNLDILDDLMGLGDVNENVGANLETTPSDLNLTASPQHNVSNPENVTLDIGEEIPILLTWLKQTNDKGMHDFKDYLQSTINKLCETIDFYKQELEEKNLLIRALTLMDANGGKIFTRDQDTISTEKTTTNSPDEYTDCDDTNTGLELSANITLAEQLNSTTVGDERNGTKILDSNKYESAEYQLKNYRRKHRTKQGIININEENVVSPNMDAKEDPSDTLGRHLGNTSNVTSPSCSILSNNDDNFKRGQWEKHNNGFASKIMKRMGYGGKGLGKREDGIVEPITTQNTLAVSKKKEDERVRKIFYILSSSMMNQMDANRLSTKDIEVKTQCHGGCTIRCMYSHLPNVIIHRPTYILLHIGSNDCTEKTSDEVLIELKQLINRIKILLPSCTVILSSPLIRADSTRANAIQKNLKVKMRNLYLPCLDNSNINHDHLSKKGLHLNDHGTRKLAKNIISLINRL